MGCKKRHGRGAIKSKKTGTLEGELSTIIQEANEAPLQKEPVVRRRPVHITTMIPPEKRRAS